jgi:probable phosphoglycerate mutase
MSVTTSFFLVRHAAHELPETVLVGRTPGVALAPVGRRQAEFLASRLSREAVTKVHSSPQQRALETAEPIAVRTGLRVERTPALDEVDFGDWTGSGFEELTADPAWRSWNERRSSARAPGGESMSEAQTRVLRHIDQTRREAPGGRIVLVSHAEIIRAAILFYLGLPLDAFGKIEVGLASLSRVVAGDWGAKLVSLNEAAGA